MLSLRRPAVRDRSRTPRHGRLIVIAAVALLASSLVTGAMLLAQTRTLQSGVELTADIVDANVRTLTQTQRELLRLGELLSVGEQDPEVLDLHRAFVGQRMREGTLSYQLQTLGTQALLDWARDLAEEWYAEVEPLVLAVVSDPGPATTAERQRARSRITTLELAFNDLVAKGEQNRKRQAGAANDAASMMLGQAEFLVVGLVVSLTGFLAVTGISLRGSRRLARERADAARRLEAANAELSILSKVARATDNMVVITDRLGLVEWVNDAFERTTGWSLAEVRGRAPGEVLQGPDTSAETVAAMSEALRRGEGFTAEVLNYTRSDDAYWVQIEVQPVNDADGALTHFIAIETDVTERRRKADALQRAVDLAEETATEKSNFLASVSHEIRTPLNGVLGLTEMLLETELSSKQRTLVDTARRRGTLLLELLNNTLSFSALEAGQMELESRPTALRSVAEETAALFTHLASERGLRLRAHVDGGVPEWAFADGTRLRQVLVNLVGNAVKFTQAGSVDIRLLDSGPGLDGTVVTFEVTDTGIGIPADRLGRLFQPFSQVDASTTRQYGGSGLGLAISQRLVAAMGSEITVDTAVGRGTTFRFQLDLPVATSPRPASERSRDVTERPDSARPLRVLVAEDDDVNQLVATHMLRRLGHDAVVAVNGVAALELLSTEGPDAFDLVLMDVHMPEMDGLTATSRIIEEYGTARPPIIAVTANALAGDRERFLAAGLDDYVSKPINGDDLAAAIERVLRGQVSDNTDASLAIVSASGDTPVVDVAAFVELHGEEARPLLGRLVAVFLESAPGLVADLRRAVSDGDVDGAGRVAHRLRGSAASICAPGIASCAGAIEDAARAGSVDGTSPFVDQLVERTDALATQAPVSEITTG